MATINANNSAHESVTINLTNTRSIDFCFNGWHYDNDYDGLTLSYYLGEIQHSKSIRFDGRNEISINVQG
ncbi:hypothetical protein [Vibrio agarivorans]|uniref:hypothetical protein n=1 Tax=Vibrio agarivorans TaxID=153622 RepID=UPI0025B44537|nr:hypothetical protein [Vibrio agarivorans]MDN3661126.1 hypothetical protein [Vibrio agarivorans]